MEICKHYKFQTSTLKLKEKVPGISVTERDVFKDKRYYCNLHLHI